MLAEHPDQGRTRDELGYLRRNCAVACLGEGSYPSVVATKTEGYGAALAVGLIAGGVLLAASAAKQDREKQRDSFRQKVRDDLLSRGLELLSATVGRDKQNAPIWLVSVRGPEGIEDQRILLPKSASPYGDQAVSSIVAAFA